jgi:hypothetical protein
VKGEIIHTFGLNAAPLRQGEIRSKKIRVVVEGHEGD